MLFHELEEFARVQHRRAFHPRVQRIGGDGVELLPRRQDEVTRIVDRHVHLLVANDVEVVLAEIGGDDARHERLDFSDRLAFEPRIDRHRARRHAGPAPDHEHRSRLRRDERREMAEHALQPHVLRLARRLHLAGVVIVAHAARQLRDGHRRVEAFA